MAGAGEPRVLAGPSEPPGQGPGDVTWRGRQYGHVSSQQRLRGGDGLRARQDKNRGPEEECGQAGVNTGSPRGDQARFVWLCLIPVLITY